MFTGFVDDEDMIPLLKRASTFAYVSLYEGFGIPVAEAMAAGVPCVTSNRSSMKEIAEGYGFLADPDSAESIKEQLQAALNTDKDSEKIRSAQDHARKFNWRSCAEGTISAFGEACGRRTS